MSVIVLETYDSVVVNSYLDHEERTFYRYELDGEQVRSWHRACQSDGARSWEELAEKKRWIEGASGTVHRPVEGFWRLCFPRGRDLFAEVESRSIVRPERHQFYCEVPAPKDEGAPWREGFRALLAALRALLLEVEERELNFLVDEEALETFFAGGKKKPRPLVVPSSAGPRARFELFPEQRTLDGQLLEPESPTLWEANLSSRETMHLSLYGQSVDAATQRRLAKHPKNIHLTAASSPAARARPRDGQR